MSHSDSVVQAKPWYREFWPWLLMLPPLLSVIGGVTMLLLATGTPSALVVADYARIEELTAERFERDQKARTLGLQAVLSPTSASGRIELVLEAPAGFLKPSALLLHLAHATDPAADRVIRLVRFGDLYAAEADWIPGRYHIELLADDESWRLSTGVVRLSGQITLRPQAAGG